MHNCPSPQQLTYLCGQMACCERVRSCRHTDIHIEKLEETVGTFLRSAPSEEGPWDDRE